MYFPTSVGYKDEFMFYWCLFIVFVPLEQPNGAAPLTLPILKTSFPQIKFINYPNW